MATSEEFLNALNEEEIANILDNKDKEEDLDKTMLTHHDRHLPNAYEEVKLMLMPQQKQRKGSVETFSIFCSNFFAPEELWRMRRTS